MTVIDYNYLPKNNDAQIEEKGETYNLTKPQIYSLEEKRMCEFTVILNGKTVFKDVVYAKMEKDSVILKNVLGETKTLKDCKIIEVDVNSTRLVLEKT